MVHIMTGPQRDVTLWKIVSILDLWNIVLSTVVRGIYFAEPHMIHVFKIYLGVYGEGTRLATPKTICAPDSSSLKPGSGPTEKSWIRGYPDSRTIYFGRTVGL